jgi:hypothetical protein
MASTVRLLTLATPGILWQRDVCDGHQKLGTQKSDHGDPGVSGSATKFLSLETTFSKICSALLGSLLGLHGFTIFFWMV